MFGKGEHELEQGMFKFEHSPKKIEYSNEEKQILNLL
jgi:hypothetical protein